MAGIIHTINTSSGKILNGLLLRQKELETEEKTYLLNDYEIEDYGEATYSMKQAYSAAGFRQAMSMMPFEYIDKTAQDFKWDLYGTDAPEEIKRLVNAFIVNFEKFRKAGKGLYIHSETRGSGKTLLACCLLNEVVKRYDLSVKFISVLEYLELTKKGYASEEDKKERDGILRTSVLVLDEIGVEVSKDWVNTTLYRLIDFRYSNKLITIVTSNLPIDDLKIDGRIKDRLNAMCIPVHMPEYSVRSQKAKEENTEFLKSVM